MQLNSDQINEIALALSKAQSSMKTPIKDKKNPHFKNQYASLGSILTACKTALNEHGISISQQLSELGGKHYLVTTLMHASGQWIRSYMLMRLDDKATAQQMGSFLTYSKRYSLCAILGVDADEDDDGEIASTPPPNQTVTQKGKALLSQEMIDDLVCRLMPDDLSAAVSFCKSKFGSEDLRHLSQSSYNILMKRAIEKMEAEGEDVADAG